MDLEFDLTLKDGTVVSEVVSAGTTTLKFDGRELVAVSDRIALLTRVTSLTVRFALCWLYQG